MKFKFVHTPKPRRFDYRPRFYDPEKEAREARKRELLGEDYKADESGEYKPGEHIRRLRIRRGIMADRSRRQRQQKTTLRTIIMLILLIVIAIWILRTDFSQTVWAVIFSGK